MKKLVTLLLVLIGISYQNQASAQGVAVVDLDKVAKDLGVLDYISVTLENTRLQMSKSLGDAQKALQNQFNQRVQLAGENPSSEVQKELLTANRELQTQFHREELKLTQDYQALRLKLINDFREELKPIAMQVARSKNFKVVLNKVMPPVYIWDDSVDITEAVIEAAKAKGLTRTIPERKAK